MKKLTVYYSVKMVQQRNQRGQFTNKSNSERRVRSIRVTDEVWDKFGEMAIQQGITRADLLEEIVDSSCVIHGDREVVKILEEALKLKANAGGAIKKRIRDALKILS